MDHVEQTFRAKAPVLMTELIADFHITPEDAAAIAGNLGHECLGFTKLQEISPTVKGSRGGYGWAQWTGPRRKAYEAYCKRNGKDPASDGANYAYLFVELKGMEGSEGGAIDKLVMAEGLQAKVIAFEKAYLRAGVKHYPSRLKYAQWALDAYRALGPRVQPVPDVPATPTPPEPSLPPTGQPAGKGGVFALIAAVFAAVGYLILKTLGVF